MRKNISLCMALAAISLGTSSLEAKDALTQITTMSGYEMHELKYNDKDLIERHDVIDEFGEYYLLYTYSDKGQCLTEECYQNLSGEFTKVTFIEYTYDDSGLLSERTNYNRDPTNPGEMLMGGRIAYVYDTDGRILRNDTYIQKFGGEEMLFQKITFKYDEKGLLVEELTESGDYFDPTKFQATQLNTYEYDEEGRRTLIHKNEYDLYGEDPTALMRIGSIGYEYDEKDGGLISVKEYSRTGNLSQSEDFTFAKEGIDDTVYPSVIEEPACNFIYENVKHRIARRTVTARDVNTGEMGLFDVYDYLYTPTSDEPAPGSGIDAAVIPQEGLSVLRHGDELVVSGLKSGDTVSVFDMSGRLVKRLNAGSGRLPLGPLQQGAYILATPSGALKFNK